MKNIIKQIQEQLSSVKLYENVKAISSFHRIQASPGFNAAAAHLCEELKSYGLEARVLKYPADGKTWAFCSKQFKEWSCDKAILKDASGRVWADFSLEPISLIQKSYPVDFREEGLDLVYLPKVENFAYPEDFNLEGKLVFYPGPVSEIYRWAVGKKGALGFVTDFLSLQSGVRDRKDMYDSRAYTSFWWEHDACDTPCFGFVLSPRQGDELRKLMQAQEAKHQADPKEPAHLKMYGFVESDLYDGTIQVVEAKIPGTTEEEVILTAHLCHPQPSANDNASGVAAVTEALRVLQQQIDTGSLAKPRRGITAIFIPEYTGVYAYLKDREADLAKLRAGLNLDMVGGKQTNGYGPLTLSGIPDTSASFVVSLAEVILDEIFAEIPTHSGQDYVSCVMRSSTGFDRGSDNYILSDPTIDIPTPMFGQWPDRNYHTSTDNVDCIDPQVLKKSACLAASYAYILANLQVGDVQPILEKALVRLQERASRQLRFFSSGVVEAGAGRECLKLEPESQSGKLATSKEDITYLWQIFAKRAEALVDFFSDKDQVEELAVVKQLVQEAKDRAKAYLAIFPSQDLDQTTIPDKAIYDQVWLRNYKAPTTRISDFFAGKEENYQAYADFVKDVQSKTHNAYSLEALSQFELTTGKSVGQIITDLCRQIPQDRAVVERFFLGYLEILQGLELVEEMG